MSTIYDIAMWSAFLLTLAYLPLFTAAASDPQSRFRKYLSKSVSTSPLKLDDTSFSDLTSLPRDYAVVTLLTALPAQFGCQLCREFQPEFDVLAKSWINGDKNGESRVLFGTLDFPDGKATYQKVYFLDHVLVTSEANRFR